MLKYRGRKSDRDRHSQGNITVGVSRSRSLKPEKANLTVSSGFLLLGTRALEHLEREIQAGSPFLGTEEPGNPDTPTSQTVTEALATPITDVIVSQKSIHMLLNPFIYSRRNLIVFHIFNPTGIPLTAFFFILDLLVKIQ